MTGLDPRYWRQRLGLLAVADLVDVLVVQCRVEWLHPRYRELRDEIDEAVFRLLARRDDVAVRRIVLHNLPSPLAGTAPGELATLNGAHADWTYRMAACATVLPPGRRPEVQRLIVGEHQPPPEIDDCLEVRTGTGWSDPVAAEAALTLQRRAGATPLTTYDVEPDGPFGDADPSVFL